MGSVFLAQQSQPVKRLVAVKVIKAGMDSRAVLARFDAERQALAMMDHPNIAKVLDAGTTNSGHPFFVMELVKGVPITQFCDDRKLSPRQRLELFVPVCQAIQHAHQKGIIHRDIKPSNVLVSLYDDRPVPKVIDFGVAKATGPQLTEQTLVTGLGAVVGTPEYMSPEQASFNQLDVDTRSDIYALGVLLYELLTGTTPIDRKSLGKAALLEVLRMVREVEAPRPSNKLSTSDALAGISANRGLEPKKLTGLLRGELDWIVMKALEKDRSRRYETANGFAADVQRYLAGEQVQAVPPSAGYRLRKLLNRNRGPATAAAVVLLALTVGMIGTGWGLVEARRQRDDAENARGLEAEQRKIALDSVEKLGKAKVEEQNRANEAEAAKAAALRSLYDARILTLRDAWENGNISQARGLLDAMRPRADEPDLRGFEWHYLDRLVHSAPSVLVTPAIDGKRMYALPEVYDGGRLLLFRQTAPNGLYFDARSYDTATGRPVDGFQPIQGKYRTRNGSSSGTLLAFHYRRGESRTRFIHYHRPYPPLDRFEWLRESPQPTDLAVYDARSGMKVADIPDLVVDPEAARQGWKLSMPLDKLENWFHLDRSLRASVLTRPKTPVKETDCDVESRLQVHDMQTSRLVTSTEALPGAVYWIQFSSDGQRVLTIHDQARAVGPTPPPMLPERHSELSVWDVAGGKRLWSYRYSDNTAQVGFQDSGQEVSLTVSHAVAPTPDTTATTRYSTLQFAAATGAPLPAPAERLTREEVFGYPLVTSSSDRRWVAIVNRNRVDLQDAKSGIIWRTFKTDQPVHAAHFVDGDRTLRVIESLAPQGVRCSSLEVPNRPKLEQSNDQSKSGQSRSHTHQLVTKAGNAWSFQATVVGQAGLPEEGKRGASDWTFRLRDRLSGEEREIRLRADLGDFFAVILYPPAISEDGRIVALGVRPALENTGFAVLDFNERKLRFVRAHPGSREIHPRISPNGQLVAYLHGKKLHVCDALTDREIWAEDVNRQSNLASNTLVEFSPDSKQLAVGFSEVRIYDSERGGLIHTLPSQDQFSPPQSSSGSFDMKAFWSDEGRKFVRFLGGQIRIWDVGTWAESGRIDLMKHGEILDLLVPSPDHQHFAVGCRTAISEEYRFQVYSIATGRPYLAESEWTKPKSHAAFSPDSTRLFYVDAPERRPFAGNSTSTKTKRVQMFDFRRDLLLLTINTPIPESTPVQRFDVSNTKLTLGFGAGETLVIDATPRTAAEVASSRRPSPSEVELPDANVGPVIMTRPNGDLHSKYPTSITLYTKDPKTASNYADVAVISHGEPAIQAWREAIRLDPTFASLHHELAFALKASKPDEAIAALRDCLKLDPNRVESLHQLGLLLFQRGKPQEAIAPLREAVRLDPQRAPAFNDLGCCLRDTGDTDGAILAFETAVALNKAVEKRSPGGLPMGISSFALPNRNLGEIFARQGKPERAAAEFKEAVRIAQYDVDLHIWYGHALRDSGKVDEAIMAFETAIKINPGAALLHSNLGWVYGFMKKDFARADAAYRKAREHAPMHAGILNDHACLLRDNGKIDEALAAFDRATELDPKFWLPYFNRGHVFLARNQPDRAIKEFQRAIETNLRAEGAYYDLALALMRDGRAAEGVDLLLTATKQHPELVTSTYPWAYNAACIAALGGTNTDVKTVSVEQRASFRKQALGLLRAELVKQKKDYEAAPIAKRGPVHQWMAHWLADADFNGVRSTGELALLPDDEQKAWREIWADISRLLEATAPESAPPPRERK